MTKPTMFGMNGSSLLAGGEAGAEAILPLKGFYDQLSSMLDERLNMAGMERYLCIAEFDRTLPGYVWMSDVKKIDFYLWSIRD